MKNATARRPAGVMTFDRGGFDTACAELLLRAVAGFMPDLLIGIRTGGLHVAEAMAKATTPPLPVLALTCRRPSTRFKPALATARQLVAALPRPVVDRLRVAEHALLTRHAARPESAPEFHFDDREVAALDGWIAAAGASPALLVVDDAVDSGATLSRVIDVVRRRAPEAATIRSAAITVTTDRPAIMPDHFLYQQLCRFPWSLDARD